MRRAIFITAVVLAAAAQAQPTYGEVKVRLEKGRLSGDSNDLRAAVETLIPFWIGTPWTFEGHTETPRAGTVACGYFVSTVLRDAGFRLNRYKLAQQAAADIVTTLVAAKAARAFGVASPGSVAAELAKVPGLYVVGLDSHVGFVLTDGHLSTFCHSNYVDPEHGVTCEPAATSAAWRASTTFVAGRIDTPEMTRKWLTGKQIRVERR